MQTACYRSDGETGCKYQLRHAAGLYWLITMEQPDGSYIRPVPLNEGGAELWRMIESGSSLNEICRQFCEKYEVSMEQARSDVCDFVEQLRTMHVDLGELK